MRAPGMTMSAIPLFVWSVFITAWLLLLSLPVLAGACCALLGKWLILSCHIVNDEATLRILAVCWDQLYAKPAEINLMAWLSSLFLLVGGNSLVVGISCLNPISLETSDKGILRDFTPEQIVDSWFPSYLTGYYEGDGYIYVPKQSRTANGKLLYASFQLALPLKDFPLASILATYFSKFSIVKKSNAKVYIMTITALEDLIQLYNLFNGNIKTLTKLEQLKKLRSYIIAKSGTERYNYDLPNLLPLNNSPLNSNAWLAGFIEADGSFHIRTTKTPERVRLSFEFSIVQADQNKAIVEAIANFLKVSLGKIENKNQYRVRTTSFESVELICSYLHSYHIFGVKWYDFLDWEKGYKYHREVNNTQLSYLFNVKLKLHMNNNRTTFQWNHLELLRIQIRSVR